MRSARSSDRRSVLIRRSTVRSRGYVGLDDDENASESISDIMSTAGSDQMSTGDHGPFGAEALLWHLDEEQQRMRGFDDVANKLLMPEETSLMIKKFEKAEDIAFGRTYQLGKPVKEFSQEAFEPHVGIVLLPGADLPEVSRLEQAGMVSAIPDQKDAAWRVGTAGEMLSNISVTPDLKVTSTDVTAQVAETALCRRIKETQQKSSFRSYSKDAVTIHSDNVEVLHDFGLAKRSLDLSATLIEVNVSSLWSLMTDYKQIILKSGPQMTVQQTKQLLDRMIEAARRFCTRSPILFRMSTRKKIIDSNNTRYGVDNEHYFRTFVTSKGIQEIIMTSASYFSALDPSAPGMDQDTQASVRPRYLQMLTLLLSLLNEEDLKATAEFLRRTYGIIPERLDMELLFLKVIPLTSINSKVFLEGLLPAVFRWPMPQSMVDSEGEVWKSFVNGLAKRGYLLPGTVEQLGHCTYSWVPAWPDEGIHSSTAFSRLQYHGDKSSTFNEIPTARFSFEPSLKSLTVILTDDTTCTIHPKDYEQISTLTKGLYNITLCEDESICDLEISEQLLNGSINEAIQVMNDAINRYNSEASSTSKMGRKLDVLRRRSGDPMVFRDEGPAARLTRNQAQLNGTIIAVAYKLGGRNVPKVEAMRYMAFHHTRVKTLFNRLCEAAGKNWVYYERYIQMVNALLNGDRSTRADEAKKARVADAAIAQMLGVDDVALPSNKIWHEYWVEVVENPRYAHELLRVKAKEDLVVSVVWRQPGQQAEVKLGNTPTRFFVAPLKPVLAAQQDDEICVGDLALLVGKYLVIATPQGTPHCGTDYTAPSVLTNWLEILDEYAEESTSRRGRNFRGKEELPVRTFI